jgi:diguanylate cyclase (GGDEF)-like protein
MRASLYWNARCSKGRRIEEIMAISITFTDENTEGGLEPLVLIVDDEICILELLKETLRADYNCLTASSGPEAIKLLEDNEIGVLLSDIRMQGMSGLEVLSVVSEISPNTVCVMVSGEQTMDSAIGALKVGAFDFIQKPFSLKDVSAAVGRAAEKYRGNIKKQILDEQLKQALSGQRDQLEYLRNHDPITGLANHEFLTDQISQVIAESKSHETTAAVVILAIDRFQNLKEGLGATLANDLLREVAGRWLEISPSDAVLARFENDNFGLLLPKIESSVEALQITRELSKALKDPIYLDPIELSPLVSAGIAIFPTDGTKAADLERAASAALADAKCNGSSSFKFYKPEMNSVSQRRLAIEWGLRHALKSGDIRNYYQPKIDFETGKIVGMEALVRWSSPELGPVPAAEIVAVAEDSGLAESLGLKVLEVACRDAKELSNQGIDLQVSVNLSGKQLADSWFLDAVEASLASSGLEPRQLELEITETSLIQNAATATDLLERVRALGVSVAIDDFGTGFSSLNYLKRFPLDTLKIDRSFVSDLDAANTDDTEFVYAIVSLAQKLRLRTVVEGVETTEQLDLLRPSGCDEWQGFLCSKPVPFEEFCLLAKASAAIGKSSLTAGL